MFFGSLCFDSGALEKYLQGAVYFFVTRTMSLPHVIRKLLSSKGV